MIIFEKTLKIKGNSPGFSKLFSPFMAFMMRNANTMHLMKLKEIIALM